MESTTALLQKAKSNLWSLGNESYPGRGIISGLDETGENLVQVYFIMGRSDNSRNRIFIYDANGTLHTAPANPAKVEDPSLIIYWAMRESDSRYAVSNGHQTEDAARTENLRRSLRQASTNWKYEPDEPNFTPRITAVVDLLMPAVIQMVILKKSPFSKLCDWYAYDLETPTRGLGYCITTYDGDDSPLPSFTGDPYLLPLAGNMDAVAQTIWDSLNEDNRVSLAVKFINIESKKSSIKIINKYEAVG